MRYLIIVLLFASCATTKPKPEIGTITLVKQSYIRGCVEGRIEFTGKTEGKNLEYCVKKSKKHVSDIEKILYGK